MADLPLNVLRYGVDAPLPQQRPLRAGPLSMIYSDGDLRLIRLGDVEVLNRLYVAVRDHNWNTIPIQLSNVQIEDEGDSFRIRYDADHREGPIDFHWQGTITGARDGTLHFEMDGEARSTFLRNRIGFCVLHPAALAGAPCTVEHVDGVRETSHFPRRISPDQPFFDLRAISHEAAPGVQAEVRMEGDTFEMEDQRNWTDASYKTYCTPLGLPFPVEIRTGTKVQQRVTVKLHGSPSQSAGTQRGRLTFQIQRRQIGAIPHLGLGLATQESALDRKEIERLRALHLSHLRVDIDFAQPDWDEMLRRAADEADAIGCRLEIAVHLSAQMADELKQLRALVGELRPSISHWLIFHKDERGASAEWVTLARQGLSDYDRVPFGAGTDAYFTELNRNRPPAEAVDLICYSINPQVHAFDNLSLMETLPVQATTVDSARLLSAGRSIAVSPITLRPRFNPNATGAEADAPDQLPSGVDPRQMSLFGAAWTVGSLKAMAESGVERVTYYETAGWRGVMETEAGSPLPDQFRSIPGGVYPLYHVLADVAGCVGAPVFLGEASDSGKICGLAFAHADGMRVLVANLTAEPQDLIVHHGGESVRVQMLNEHTAPQAMRAPEVFRSEERPPIRPAHGQTALRLLPYAVVRLDVEEK